MRAGRSLGWKLAMLLGTLLACVGVFGLIVTWLKFQQGGLPQSFILWPVSFGAVMLAGFALAILGRVVPWLHSR